jgi:hypothetical protein
MMHSSRRGRADSTPDSRSVPVSQHGLYFDDCRFWVIHRRQEYGPFDYQWSPDLSGVELTFRGHKFGEICSDDELFADLKEFGLPMRVVTVASLTIGCLLYGILHGLGEAARNRLLVQRLIEHECAEYLSDELRRSA